MKHLQDFTEFVNKQKINEASTAGRAWSGRIKNIDNLFSWLYSKDILNKGDKAKKDKIFWNYYRWYNDGDFPKILSSKGISKWHSDEKIERALEDELEKFLKEILNKYTGKFDRKDFYIDTIIKDLRTLENIVKGYQQTDGIRGEPDPYGLLNYWGNAINTKDTKFEEMLSELRPLYDDSKNATMEVIEIEKESGIYKDLKPYETPGSNSGLSWLRNRMQNDKIWTPDLEKKYQKVKTHMLKMGEILNTVIDAAEKVKSNLDN